MAYTRGGKKSGRQGFALVQVIVAAAIIGILGLVLAQMINTSNQAQRSVTSATELTDVFTNVKAVLSDASLCKNALKGGNNAALTYTGNPTGTPVSSIYITPQSGQPPTLILKAFSPNDTSPQRFGDFMITDMLLSPPLETRDLPAYSGKLYYAKLTIVGRKLAPGETPTAANFGDLKNKSTMSVPTNSTAQGAKVRIEQFLLQLISDNATGEIKSCYASNSEETVAQTVCAEMGGKWDDTQALGQRCVPQTCVRMSDCSTGSTDGNLCEVFCHTELGESLVSCSGSRHKYARDTCDEEDCGYIGTIPVASTASPGVFSGCRTGADAEGGATGPYAIAYCRSNEAAKLAYPCSSPPSTTADTKEPMVEIVSVANGANAPITKISAVTIPSPPAPQPPEAKIKFTYKAVNTLSTSPATTTPLSKIEIVVKATEPNGNVVSAVVQSDTTVTTAPSLGTIVWDRAATASTIPTNATSYIVWLRISDSATPPNARSTKWK